MTGRLVTQKGLDLILGARELLGSDAQFVFLGSGEPRYEQALVELATSAPDRIGVQLDFTDRLEHRLMAGADIFLMPSLYEPCGLTQMRAQRYGALPVVRRVGGLADTVEDGVTGFAFDALHARGVPGGRRSARSTATPTPRKWQAHGAPRHGPRLQLGALGGRSTSRSTAAPSPTPRRDRSAPPMDFVLALHSHLPYVLNHGRWPHGSDWLCEAALDTYLPLLEALRGARRPTGCPRRSPSASRRCSPTSSRARPSSRRWRRSSPSGSPPATRRPPRSPPTGEAHLLPLVDFWRERLRRLRAAASTSIGGDIVGGLPRARGGGPARDHRLRRDARLPPAARPRREHPAPARGRPGRAPPALRPGARRAAGCRSAPIGRAGRGSRGRPRPRAGIRRGIEEHLADAGFRYFFVDAHLAARRAAARRLRRSRRATRPCTARASAADGDRAALALPGLPGGAREARRTASPRCVRDPRASMQVWSRFQGYPGDGAYLEFHKMRWPGGLKLWRVTGGDVDLGAKEPYDPATAALERARGHADHFAGLLGEIAAAERQRPRRRSSSRRSTPSSSGTGGSRAPTSSAAVYRALARRERGVRPVTGVAAPRRPPVASSRSGCPPAPGAPTATSACGSASRRRGPGSGSGRWRSASGTRRPAALANPAARPVLAAGGARAAAGPVVRLAVHHLDRRRGRLRRAALHGALRRRRGAARRAGPRGGRAARARPSAAPRSSAARDDALPRRPARRRRGARRLPLTRRSADRWPRSGSSSDSTCTSRSATSTTSSSSTSTTSTGRCSSISRGAGFFPAVLHLSGPLLEWLEQHEPAYLDQLGRLAADGKARAAARRLLRAGARLAPASRPGRADPVDARGGPPPLRGRRPRPLAHRAGLGAGARRRPRRRRRPLRAGGRPAFPRHRLRAASSSTRRSGPRATASGSRSSRSTSGSAT